MTGALAWLLALPRWAKFAGGAVALGLAALLWLHFHDARVIDRHDAAVNLQAEKAARAADNTAADRRITDAASNAAQEEAYHAAIDAAPPGAPAPAARALGCQRLRRAGKVDADLPALCRRGGAEGSEAGPD